MGEVTKNRSRYRLIPSEFGRVREKISPAGGKSWYIDFRPHFRIKFYSVKHVSFDSEAEAKKILENIRDRIGRGISPLIAISHYKVIEGLQNITSIDTGGKWKLEYRQRMWDGAKSRAKKKGIPFNIHPTDIVIPDYCPILNIQLQPTDKGNGRSNTAPSIDRINPALGYIKGNVIVISWKANRIKSNHSAEDLKKVADWMEYLDHCPPICKID